MHSSQPAVLSTASTWSLSGPVFLTGATGFIGRRLTQTLIEAGCDVAALILPEDAHNLPAGARAYIGDVTDSTAVSESLAAFIQLPRDSGSSITVYHLAAVGIANPGLSMHTACRVNVNGVINVLDAARALHSDGESSPIRRIVLVGSSYEYGARRSDDELDPFNSYSASKAAAWAFARAAYNAWGAPVVWVRPFQVYGPGQFFKALIPAAVLAALADADFRMTRGEQQRDFVYVDDVVEGFLAAGSVPEIEGHVLDFGAGELRRVYDVVARIWALTGAKGEILSGALPYRPGEVPAIPANVRRTRLLTGWEARTSLDVGLQRTIDALRRQGQVEQQMTAPSAKLPGEARAPGRAVSYIDTLTAARRDDHAVSSLEDDHVAG